MADEQDDGPAQINADEFSRSLTGFEEIAIEQLFHRKLKHLADDETMMMRALLVVEAKRDGAADLDAFRGVMLLPLAHVVDRFEQPADVDEDPSLAEERDRSYADFVVGVGVSFMPDQFNALTLGQRAALIEAANRRNRS